MLSCHFVLALALFQAGSPSPRGAAGGTRDASGDAQQQGQSKQDSTTQASGLPVSVQPRAPEVDREQLHGDNHQNSIELTSLPPVTIADKAKTAMDHVYEWGPGVCNLFLCWFVYFKLSF